MRQALVYILFIAMVGTVFTFLGINLLFYERLMETLNFRFFIDITFIAVSCFFLPCILFLESELKPKKCILFVLVSVAATMLSFYAYSMNFDTSLALMICLVYNVLLLMVFVGIHIKRRHPIIVELEALEAQAYYDTVQVMFEGGFVPAGAIGAAADEKLQIAMYKSQNADKPFCHFERSEESNEA